MKSTLSLLVLLSSSAWGQSFITLKEFYQQLGPAQSYIKMKPLEDKDDPLIKIKSQGPKLNTKYHLDNDTYFETDTDELMDFVKTKPLVDARKKLFHSYKFETENGNFVFPYPILSHWDILPHPPIQSLKEDQDYYSKTYIEGNIRNNPALLETSLNQEFNALTGSDLTYGNKLKVLQNKEVIIEMMKLLRDAKDFVLASNMFITCDPTLDPLLNLMKEKIDQGVEIHLILEKVFALKYSKCFKKIRKLGVQITYAREMIKLKNRYVYHNKFWIFDNKKALVYGANLLDSEVESTGFNQMYRDAGVRLEGPIVTQLSQDYLKIRSYLGGKYSAKLIKINDMVEKQIQQDELEKKRGLKNLDGQKNLSGMCRVVFQGPHHIKTAVTDLYQRLAEVSKDSIFITSTRLPSLEVLQQDVHTAKLLETLYQKALADKNYQVDIMTNNWMGATDVKSQNYTNKGLLSALYKKFAKAENNLEVIDSVRQYLGKPDRQDNFNVWNYFNYYHGKMMLVDNTLSIIGSFNMNRNSNERSFEMALVCYEPEAIQDVQRSIILDLINSVPILE